MPVEMRGRGASKHCVTNTATDEEAAIAANAASYFETMKLEAMLHCVQKCNLIFFSGRDAFESAALIPPPPSWIFIRSILFILLLGAEWMECRSVHSGIGMRNKKKVHTFHILAILIPEL